MTMKNIWVMIKAVSIKSFGRLSNGIRLALKHGLTSGVMLEYIYDNKSRGISLLGKWIDRLFLNCSDLQALRVREHNVKEYIQEFLKENKFSLKVIDIACGFSRYMREALFAGNLKQLDLILVDTDDSYRAVVKKSFSDIGVLVRYENKSALDESFLQSLSPANLVVASGFYDWIIDDTVVQKSMGLVGSILSKSGVFILTGQSKNSDLLLMRYAFTDFNHNPLLMKMRSSDEMIQWLTVAGFKIQRCDTDKKGYYYTIKAVKL